jgi:hypothetical protein
MQISEEDGKKISDWFMNRYPNAYRCEFCCSDVGIFSVANQIFQLPIFYKPNESPTERAAAPMLLLFCSNCENSKLFNALVLQRHGCPGINILPPDKKKNVLSFLDYFKKK